MRSAHRLTCRFATAFSKSCQKCHTRRTALPALFLLQCQPEAIALHRTLTPGSPENCADTLQTLYITSRDQTSWMTRRRSIRHVVMLISTQRSYGNGAPTVLIQLSHFQTLCTQSIGYILVGLTTVPYTATAVRNTVLYGYGPYHNQAVLTKSWLVTVRLRL